MFDKIISILKSSKIDYELHWHEPVRDFEAASKVKNRVGYNGVETKCMVLRSKSGRLFVYVLIKDRRMDLKWLSSKEGEHITICPIDEMVQRTGCKPFCISPFGYEDDVIIVVDDILKQYDQMILTPCIPEATIIMKVDDYYNLLNMVPNMIIEYKAIPSKY